MFGHPVYSLYGPGPSIAVSGPNEEFFNSTFALWMSGKNVSDGCCRPISVHKVCKSLGLMQIRLELLSILWQEVSRRQARAVPGKHVMSALMLVKKEAEIKTEAIPVQKHNSQK